MDFLGYYFYLYFLFLHRECFFAIKIMWHKSDLA